MQRRETEVCEHEARTGEKAETNLPNEPGGGARRARSCGGETCDGLPAA